VQGNDGVATLVLTPGETHVTNDADQSPARDEYPMAVLPHLVELGQELLVIFNVPELPLRLSVLLQRPVGR